MHAYGTSDGRRLRVGEPLWISVVHSHIIHSPKFILPTFINQKHIPTMNDVFQLIKEKIIQQEMSSVDAALIAFVLVFILGSPSAMTVAALISIS